MTTPWPISARIAISIGRNTAPARKHHIAGAQRSAERQHVLAGRRVDLLQSHRRVVDQLGLLDRHDGIGAFGNRRAGHDSRRRAGRHRMTRHGAGRDFFQNLPRRLAVAAATA